jgi:hypothetical protein
MNEKILRIPYEAVREDWNLLQKFLELKGNPKYILVGDVNLRRRQDIPNLGSLVGVDGDLDLGWSSIESLGELEFVSGNLNLSCCKKIKTLGKLKKIEGYLSLSDSTIESLGELEFVGSNLWIDDTNIHPSEINKVEVIGDIIR